MIIFIYIPYMRKFMILIGTNAACTKYESNWCLSVRTIQMLRMLYLQPREKPLSLSRSAMDNLVSSLKESNWCLYGSSYYICFDS